MKLQQRIKEKLLKRFGLKKCKNVQKMYIVFWNEIEDTLVTLYYIIYIEYIIEYIIYNIVNYLFMDETNCLMLESSFLQ